MKVSELRKALVDIQTIYLAAGANAPAKDMAALADAMAQSDHEDVDEFLDRLKPALSVTDDPETRAEVHLLAIMNAGSDKNRFYAALDNLQNDKNIRAKDLDTIGSAYAMAPEFGRLFKTRADKLRQIKETFHERKNFEDRGKVIDELLPWQ